jgi:hypothetical protein
MLFIGILTSTTNNKLIGRWKVEHLMFIEKMIL